MGAGRQTTDDRIRELEAENAALRRLVAVLLAQVQELEARLAQDSHNSGQPLPSDGLTRTVRSLRRRSGQPAHHA